MSKQVLVALGVVVLVVVGGYLLMNRTVPTPSPTGEVNMVDQTPTAPPMATDSAVQAGVKEVTVTSKGLNFDPKEIRVKLGDKVKVTYKNTMGQHDFVLDEFKVKTKLLSAGTEETVEFVADKKGSYEYYCSVSGHRAAGMKGTLIVE